MIDGNKSVDILKLADWIENHEITLDCDHVKTIDRLLNACAKNLYGSKTKKKICVSFNFGNDWAEMPIE